jgi:hypothetical protein
MILVVRGDNRRALTPGRPRLGAAFATNVVFVSRPAGWGLDDGYDGPTTVEPMADLRERLGRTEGELAGLRVALGHVTAERDRLLTELVQARKGWLERLLEVVRKR